ncbi:MAG: cobalamin-dependent protein [candidate division KSB1 bacterium]|nr:cobalamin-dependent protein [candidate division KSB1 bacterium]
MDLKMTAAEELRRRREELAEAVVALQYAKQPDVWRPFGDRGLETSIRDAAYHLIYLSEAVQADEPTLFTEYLSWVQSLFTHLPLPPETLPVTLECMQEVLNTTLKENLLSVVRPILDAGIESLSSRRTDPSEFLPDGQLGEKARSYLDALLAGDRLTAGRIVMDLLQSGTPIKQIYLGIFQPVQREIGRLWQNNRISVAQEHFCTAATQTIMSQLYPYLFTGEKKSKKLVACCIGGELHEIGARIVADFMEMEGWDTYFLGANTPAESILKALGDQRADLLAVSATMTFHVSRVADLIRQLRESRLADVPVLVGGYPFNISQNLWRKVGADGWAPDAERAVAAAEQVICR